MEVYFVVQYDVLCFLNPKNTWLITLFVLQMTELILYHVRIIFTLTIVLETFNYVISTDRHTLRIKGNNKITELRTILQRESQNS